MKKYIISVLVVVGLLLTIDYFYYHQGSLYLPSREEITCSSTAKNGKLYIDKEDEMEVFDIRGVNLGLGKPGHFATDLAITEEEYLRWFRQIQEMGANVIRTYTIAHPTFYEAFYKYNLDNPNPLYLIHGVWVDDYLINSSYSAFDEAFYEPFLKECKAMLDVVHGRHKERRSDGIFADHYKWDISPWVYGYILGIEWEGNLVVFTNDSIPQQPQYQGKYLYTKDAHNFEIFLAQIGDTVIDYETDKYGTQHAVAFANWPTTCPLTFSEEIEQLYGKLGKVNTENIYRADAFQGALFASYHIYPYYPEYMQYEGYYENTYLAYLTKLNKHHKMPVVISEFGIPSSRGIASYEQNRNLGRDQGDMNEVEQGEALISLYEDIKNAGSAGGIVFIWQDEWFKRTWNTIPTVDLNHSIYWNDRQTNEQHFGLLSFDPGEEASLCYVDGDRSDWSKKDVVTSQDGYTLSMKYDLESIYLMVEKEGHDFLQEPLYIPFDVTPKSGSKKASKWGLSMSEDCDFLLELKGTDDSRLWVQERYDTTNAIYAERLKWRFNPFTQPPKANSDTFVPINLPLHERNFYRNGNLISFEQYCFEMKNHIDDEVQIYRLSETYETGLLHYGNGNPSSEEFDSLTDFCAGDGFVEIRLPWQLLNFGDPSEMRIHDDYYEKYGVEYIHIDSIGVGVGDGTDTVEIAQFELEPLGKDPVYHERLKQSYYILKDYWSK